MVKEKLYSETAEKILLGIMLLDNSVIDEIASKLKKDFFYLPRYGQYFEKIINLYKETDSVDIVMLSNEFPSTNTVEIASLTDEATTSSNFDYYVQEIRKNYIARKYKYFTNEKLSNLSANNVDEIVNQTDDFVTNILNDVSSAVAITSKEFIEKQIKRIEEARVNAGKLLGLDCGFDNLNTIFDGFPLGELVIIGARPSIGKSAFSTQLFYNFAVNGSKPCMFSFEMSEKEIANRMTAVSSNIFISKIKHGLLTMPDYQKLQDAFNTLYTKEFALYDSASISRDFNDVVSKIKIHAKQGYKIFFVDHIGLLKFDDNNIERYRQIGEMTDRLHTLAQTLNVCIVCLCQLKRDSEGKEPMLSSLRESGDIEQNANIIAFLHRDRQTGNEVTIPTKLIVAKNRDNPCGTINFDFIPNLTKFREVNESNYQSIKNTQKRTEIKEPSTEDIPY